MATTTEVDVLMKHIFLAGLLYAAAYADDARAPDLRLDGNLITIQPHPNQSVLKVCTARMAFMAPDGPSTTSESYLLQFNHGFPLIADRIDGESISLEVRDVDHDGQTELLVFFGTGANGYGVKIYHISKGFRPVLYLLSGQPEISNMHAVDVGDGEIRVKIQNRISVNKAEIETIRYRLEGDHVKQVGASKTIVTE